MDKIKQIGRDAKNKIKNMTHKDKHHHEKDVKKIKKHSKSRSHSRGSKSSKSKSRSSSRSSHSPPKHVIEGHPTKKEGKDLEHEMQKLKNKMKHH